MSFSSASVNGFDFLKVPSPAARIVTMAASWLASCTAFCSFSSSCNSFAYQWMPQSVSSIWIFPLLLTSFQFSFRKLVTSSPIRSSRARRSIGTTSICETRLIFTSKSAQQADRRVYTCSSTAFKWSTISFHASPLFFAKYGFTESISANNSRSWQALNLRWVWGISRRQKQNNAQKWTEDLIKNLHL